jgi:hypothetical protein
LQETLDLWVNDRDLPEASVLYNSRSDPAIRRYVYPESVHSASGGNNLSAPDFLKLAYDPWQFLTRNLYRKGENMHPTRATGLVTIVLTLVFFSGHSAFADSSKGTNSVTFYTDCLNGVISKCELKEFLKVSSSEHLRHSVQLSMQKADYYREKSAELLEQMIRSDLEQKPYKVEYFLNSRFFSEYGNSQNVSAEINSVTRDASRNP